MKGVSPVIATVLMVAVAIAAAVVFYSWIMSTTASTTTQASAKAGEIGKYSLMIESAKCFQNGSGYDLNFYIRNDSDVSITDTNFTYTVKLSSGDVVKIGKLSVDKLPANGLAEFNISNLPSSVENRQITFVLQGPSGISISPASPVTCK